MSLYKKSMKTGISTLLALLAFAANSILCKVALGTHSIDAASFTSIRLFSGIVILVVLSLAMPGPDTRTSKGSWKGALALFIYASCFSFGYLTLDTGVGALILFGAVQLTIIISSIFLGNRLHALEWGGIITSFTGFFYLVLPTLSTPSLWGFILMTLSGIAWGGYTLLGKSSKNPLADTTYNFVRTLPLLILLLLFSLQNIEASFEGIILAIISGSIASGVGYTIWYIALRNLSSTIAAVAQLFVPILATLGGVLFLGETLTLRFILSIMLVLGGIALVVWGKSYKLSKSNKT